MLFLCPICNEKKAYQSQYYKNSVVCKCSGSLIEVGILNESRYTPIETLKNHIRKGLPTVQELYQSIDMDFLTSYKKTIEDHIIFIGFSDISFAIPQLDYNFKNTKMTYTNGNVVLFHEEILKKINKSLEKFSGLKVKQLKRIIADNFEAIGDFQFNYHDFDFYNPQNNSEKILNLSKSLIEKMKD